MTEPIVAIATIARLAEAAAEIRRVFSFDPLTGEIVNRVARGRWGEYPAGSVAKSKRGEYLCVTVQRKKYAAHRVAWLLTHGSWPNAFLDHINGDHKDNRLCNLREATNAQNQQNQRRPHRDGRNPHLGVCWHKSTKKWRAYISCDGRNRDLGYFKSADEAIAAYLAAKVRLHPFQTIQPTHAHLRFAVTVERLMAGSVAPECEGSA
jgi:hypothetical protein